MDDYYDTYQNFQSALAGFHQPIEPVKERSENKQDFSKIPGIPGIDYPIHHTVPPTSFSCAHVPIVPGMYANVETGCQVLILISSFYNIGILIMFMYRKGP